MLGYERDSNEWDFVFKDNGTASENHKIYTWKTTRNEVYFRIALDTSPKEHVFIKFTKSANLGIMRSVQLDGCAQLTYAADVNSSTVTLKRDDEDFFREDEDTQYKDFRSWTFSSSQPALFGILKYTLKNQRYNNDDEATTSTTDSYEITNDSSPTEQPSDVYNDADFYGADASKRHYCLVTWDDTATTTFQRYTINPIDFTPISATTITCSTGSDTNDVTIGTETFNPEVDLAPPFNTN